MSPPSRLGQESPTTHGERHWTHRLPERVCRGERHGAHKLTERDVLSMRSMYATGCYSTRFLAFVHKISQKKAWEIVTGRAWKCVPAADVGGR